MTEEPAPRGKAAEACHHMGPVLRRVADGEAGPVARAAVHLHTLSCDGCRQSLVHLKAEARTRSV